MPIYESACIDKRCEGSGYVVEWYARSFTSMDPQCATCGGSTARLISKFSPIWAHSMSHYNDKSKPNADKDSHVMWRVRSSRSGKPEAVVIDSVQKQRAFCREEGLRMPDEVCANAHVSKDGKTMYTRGMAGQWV